MAGTMEGGKRAAATNKKVYGANFYKTIGRMGGKAGVGSAKGFASWDTDKVRLAGAKGGAASRRKKYS